MVFLLLGGLAFVVLICLLFLGIFLYKAAKNKQQATFVEEGTIEFVVGGENLIDILLNVDGHVLVENQANGRMEIVKIKDKSPGFKLPHTLLRDWLREKFGFYWVSITYPAIKIHEFKIQKSRLRQNTNTKTPILDMVETDKDTSPLKFLLFTLTHPVAISNIETKEGGAIDLVVLVTIQVVYPYLLVMLLKGKFFEPLDEAIRSRVISHFSSVRYEDFRNKVEEKTRLIEEIIKVNGESNDDPNGIIHRVGLRITAVSISGYDLTGDNKALKDAYVADDIAKQQGAALITKATLALEAAKKDAEAAAAPTRELITAMEETDEKTRELVAHMNMVGNLSGPNSKITVLGNVPFITQVPSPTSSSNKNQKNKGEKQENQEEEE